MGLSPYLRSSNRVSQTYDDSPMSGPRQVRGKGELPADTYDIQPRWDAEIAAGRRPPIQHHARPDAKRYPRPPAPPCRAPAAPRPGCLIRLVDLPPEAGHLG